MTRLVIIFLTCFAKAPKKAYIHGQSGMRNRDLSVQSAEDIWSVATVSGITVAPNKKLKSNFISFLKYSLSCKIIRVTNHVSCLVLISKVTEIRRLPTI
jgi:hypothetical protein